MAALSSQLTTRVSGPWPQYTLRDHEPTAEEAWDEVHYSFGCKLLPLSVKGVQKRPDAAVKVPRGIKASLSDSLRKKDQLAGAVNAPRI